MDLPTRLERRHVVALAAAALLAGLSVPTVTADHGGAFSHCTADTFVDADADAADLRGAEGVLVELTSPIEPFSPASLVIDAGTCVKFVNADSTVHTVRVLADTSGHVDEDVDPMLAAGESTTALFEEPGTYAGNCEIHAATMHGVIQVLDG